jgi:tetratricopeptide (TPR) repeat protein
VQVATLELLAAHQRDLLSTLRERGAHADFLVDGSLVVVFDNRSSAVDQAIEAAQAALLILDRWSGAQVAVSTGRGFRPGTIPVGEALDRAAQILMSGAVTKEGVLAIGKVRVDAITAGLLSGRFQLTEQRGDVFLLEGNVTALDESRPLLGKPTPCVGRELELGQLEATLSATIEESMAQALVILGAPGSGKSRLRHEFLRRLSAQEKDVQILIGRGVPLSAGAAFGILGQALRGLCAVNDAHSQEERSQRFRTRIAERLPPQQAHRVLPLLAELAQVELVGAGGPSLRPAGQDPSLKQEQVSHALIDFLRAETTAHPVLLIIEDLHWGDSATVQLVDRALQELAEQPLLVLVLARPEVEDQFPRLFARRKRQQIRLSGLGRRACERLIREALGQRLSPTLEARIIAQAAGNALFLEELIRAAAEGKTEGTSDTVMVMLQARLSRLPIEARTTLCAASIFGSTFWGAGLTVLLDDRQGTRVAPSLPILVELELIQPNRESLLAGEVAYSFRHDLMRDAAYELLTPEDRTLGHRLAAGFLESTTAPDPNVLAEHYFSGGDSQQAAKWFHRAATQALDSNELATAMARADRALQLGVTGIERGQVFALQATAAYWQRDEPATRRYAEQALTELPEGSAGWYLCVAHVLVASGRLQDFVTVTRWLDAVLRAVPDSGALPSLALCLSRAGYMFMMQGRLAEMQRMREQLTILAIEIPDSEPLAMAQVHHFRSASAMILGDIMEGIREMQQTVEAFERAQDYRNALMERNTLACNLIEIGQFAEAERLCRFNLAQRERSTLPTVRSMTLIMLGYALTFSSGQKDEAEQTLLDAIASSQSAANRLHEGWARSALARLYFVAGALEKAEQQARAAMTVSVESASFQSWPLGWLARAPQVGTWQRGAHLRGASAGDHEVAWRLYHGSLGARAGPTRGAASAWSERATTASGPIGQATTAPTGRTTVGTEVA